MQRKLLPQVLLHLLKSSQNRRPVEPPGSPVEANGGQTTSPDLRPYPVNRILEALGQFLNRQQALVAHIWRISPFFLGLRVFWPK
jgi:hypothetical protein